MESTMPIKLYFDCYPCLLRQVLDAIGYLNLDEETSREILNKAMEELIRVGGKMNSSELAAQIHHHIIQKGAGMTLIWT